MSSGLEALKPLSSRLSMDSAMPLCSCRPRSSSRSSSCSPRNQLLTVTSGGQIRRLINVFAYVAPTDEEAEREFLPHIKFFFEDCLRVTPGFLFPPGYLSTEQFRERVMRPALHGEFDFDAMTEQFRVVAGTPERVAQAIAQWVTEANSTRVNCHLHLGDMPHWKTVKSTTLFAENVIPRVRELLSQQSANLMRGAAE